MLVDLGGLPRGAGVGVGGKVVVYDLEEVTRRVRSWKLAAESEVSLAVRLVVSEVGADRLVTNRYGLLEALGIISTVYNRLEPVVYNPLGIEEAPAFPGCGPLGSFASCIPKEEYLGMGGWRALDPRRVYRPELLADAADVAVLAWWLLHTGHVADPTGGATSYVHRCGATAYGLPTHYCDGHMGRPERDVPGGNPHTGPILFKAPGAWVAHRGHYKLREARRFDYRPWTAPPAEEDPLAADAELSRLVEHHRPGTLEVPL